MPDPQPHGRLRVGVFGLFGLATAACPSPEVRHGEDVMTIPAQFACDDAARLLAHPEAVAGPCNELLPGLWRVVLRAAGIGPGDSLLRTFIWEDGQAVSSGGGAQLARFLRTIRAHARDATDAYAVQVLLEATGGAAPGFAPTDVFGEQGGVHGAVGSHPFSVVLVRSTWAAPRVGGPPGGGPPGGGPPGGGPPGGGPPGGGVAPPSVARARLELDPDYRGHWIVELQRQPGGPFEEMLRQPVAP
jgi:hypothetical protein